MHDNFDCSGGKSNRKCASITSNPLFINVAESIVIFRPIFQFGCLSASATVIEPNVSIGRVRNGPPDEVRISFSTSSFLPASRHCSSAECSESIGMIIAPVRSAVRLSNSPAATRDSLLARASVIPSLRV